MTHQCWMLLKAEVFGGTSRTGWSLAPGKISRGLPCRSSYLYSDGLSGAPQGFGIKSCHIRAQYPISVALRYFKMHHFQWLGELLSEELQYGPDTRDNKCIHAPVRVYGSTACTAQVWQHHTYICKSLGVPTCLKTMDRNPFMPRAGDPASFSDWSWKVNIRAAVLWPQHSHAVPGEPAGWFAVI